MNSPTHSPQLRAGILLIVSCALLNSGCVTSRAIKNYEGDDAVLEFRLASNTMPAPRVYWSESPPHAETMLTLRLPAADCESVSIYVNPTADSSNLLDEKTLSVAPARPGGSTTDYWQYIPADPCTILLLAGNFDDGDFSGVQYATVTSDFERLTIDLAKDRIKNEDDDLPAYLWPLAVVMVPVYATVAVVTVESFGLIPRKDRDFEHPVTVSFDFPDGSREETIMSEEEAIELLDGPFYQDGALFPADRFNSNFARFWVRAALLKLELDFREEQIAQWNDENGTEYSTLALVNVDGLDGDWLVDPRNGSEPATSLYTRIENPRFIRCRLNGSPKERAGIESTTLSSKN